GSRNGFAPLVLWYALKTVGLAGYRRWIAQCLDTADYAVDRLRAIGRTAWRNRHSITVVFDRPSPAVTSKWQLAVQGGIAHVITMPHVTREHIAALVADVEADGEATAGATAGAAREVDAADVWP
ncbi:MAG: hypothetical protein ACRDD1_03740, partial [Planctomycetia bacterium]